MITVSHYHVIFIGSELTFNFIKCFLDFLMVSDGSHEEGFLIDSTFSIKRNTLVDSCARIILIASISVLNSVNLNSRMIKTHS